MSAKKKRKKKITRAKKQPVRSYKARKKGGRYVYPAGTFTAQRILLEAEEAREPVAEPAPEPEIPEPAEIPQAQIVLPEPQAESHGFPFRQMNIVLTCALFLCAGMTFMRTNKAPQRLAGSLKLQSETDLNDSLRILDAETAADLNAVVSLKDLRKPLEDYLKEQSGTWALYLKNLSTQEELKINDAQMECASLIKLYVAGTYLEALDEGKLSATPASENALERMITWSDNNAWTALETFIGGGIYENGISKVNEFAKKHGFKETGRLTGADSIYSPNASNYSSVSEVGRLLNEVYDGTFVSEDASEKLMSLLKDQHLVSKIPAGLPEDVSSANKTGELLGIENDAAIVFGLNTDYILVVMSADNQVGIAPYPELSSMIYKWLNPGTEDSDE